MGDKYNNNQLDRENRLLKSNIAQRDKKIRDLESDICKIEQSKNRKSKILKWLRKTISGIFLGLGLKKSIEKGINEYTQTKKLSSDTLSDISSSLIRRLTRVEIIGLFVTIISIVFLGIQTYLLDSQNTKIDNQNNLINTQNSYLVEQTSLQEKQTSLQEANRRSSLVFLLSNIMDAIDTELRNTSKNSNRNLSSQLIGRIVALSRSLKPYRYLLKDKLTHIVSPERSHLFISLINSNLGEPTYKKIFNNGDFTHLELKDLWIKDIPFGNINFSNSIFDNVNFEYCNFGSSRFDYLVSDVTTFMDCSFISIRMIEAYFDNINFNSCSFEDAIELRRSLIDKLWINNSCVGVVHIANSFIDTTQFENSFFGYFNFHFDEKEVLEKVIRIIPETKNIFTKKIEEQGLEYCKNYINFSNVFTVNLFVNVDFFETFQDEFKELNFYNFNLNSIEELKIAKNYISTYLIKKSENSEHSFALVDTTMTPKKMLLEMMRITKDTTKSKNVNLSQIIRCSSSVLNGLISED